jgi:hypothetical protein
MVKKVFQLAIRIWRPPLSPYRPSLVQDEPPDLFFITLLFYTVSYFTQLGVRIEALGAISHEFIVGVALIVMCVLSIMIRPPRVDQEHELLGALAFFAIVNVLMIPLAVSPPVAYARFMENISKNMVFCLFLVALVRSPRHLMGFTAVYVFSMFWVYQEAVRGLITGNLVWRNQGILRLHGAVPRYGHANGISLAACMIMPFLFYLSATVRRFALLYGFLAGTAALAGLCIVYSGSRAGYVGMLALVPYWVLDGPGKLKRIFVVIVVGAALIPFIPDDYKERFDSIGGEETEGRSREARIEILEHAWQIFKLHPLGVGVDGFQIVRQRMFGEHQDTHNLYAQIATHLGVQGLLAFGILVVTMFRSLQRSLKRLKSIRRILMLQMKTGRLPRDAATTQYSFELQVLQAIVRSVKMLLYFMLVNGLFAHTLYHVIWWMLPGLALATGIMTQKMLAETRRVADLRDREAASSAMSAVAPG